MKLKLKDKEYNGYVAQNENDVLTIILHTTDNFDDVADSMTSVTSITTMSESGNEAVIRVTEPLLAKRVSQNVYALEFSTRLTIEQELEAALQTQSDAIDELLVMLVEG